MEPQTIEFILRLIVAIAGAALFALIVVDIWDLMTFTPKDEWDEDY